MEMKQESILRATGERTFMKGMVAALPIVIGYLPIALAYGLLARQAEIPLLHIVLMSALVYAGASQFMAVNMITAGAGAIEIVFATFILNLRHFIMGLSLMNLLKRIPVLNKIIVSAGMTDETFALTAIKQEEATAEKGHHFAVGLMLAAYASWVLGSLVGGLLADLIPAGISQSMAIALYAMFIGLLVPSVRKEIRVGIVAVISMVLCYAFTLYFPSGWAIVFATIGGAFFGAFLLKGEGQ